MHQDPVLMGECLFRGARWLQAPKAARSLVRGLLCVDPIHRLTAAAACEHPWMLCAEKDSQSLFGDSRPYARAAWLVDWNPGTLLGIWRLSQMQAMMQIWSGKTIVWIWVSPAILLTLEQPRKAGDAVVL
eukprot:g22430.t1